jgi:hypothetical protein
MKKLILGIFMVSNLFGVDYNTMSLEELLSKKGTIPQEDRASFQSAMQSKMSTMSTEERQALSKSKKGMGNGNGVMKRLQDGTGGGNMYKGSRGFGGGGKR